jgi:DNA ligase-1
LEALGGEGLMMRRAGSRYESGRSTTLLKVKSFMDSEARVLKHLEGAGRHKGRLGALFVEMEDGTTFSVGTGFSDAERESPPPVGSFITFRYQACRGPGPADDRASDRDDETRVYRWQAAVRVLGRKLE